MQKIIDVSKWQGNIDYDKVKKDGKIEGVILRSSIGNSTDDKFFEYADGFTKAGLPIIGIYHFSHATNVDEVKKEAVLVTSNASKIKLPKNSIIFFDFEYESLDILKSKNPKASVESLKTIIDEMTNKFCSMVISAGYKAGIYFNPDFYQNWFNKKTIDKYSKWLADWRGSRSMSCDIWQFGTITVPGINGTVDGNECYITDIAKLIAPKKSNEEVANDVIKGFYGVGEERKKRLTAEGYDYKAVQAIVNRKTNNTFNKITPATLRDINLSGAYVVTSNALNMRYAPGIMSDSNVIKVIKQGTVVHNYGYYTDIKGIKWLYVQVGNTVGHVDSRYISKK